MKTKRLLSLLLGMSLLTTASAQFDSAPAFPGAEGFGRYTSGGRGGAVYHVTKLTDDGSEGTLRWALKKGGKRTIVFDVSGTIYLTSELSVSSGNVSILGQTAPGDGICVADYPFTIQSDNVIIRYMRFRLGNRHVADHEGDGLGGMDLKNIIVDHCSVSWSIDECLSVYGSKNITVQWNIVDQSLVNSGHSKGSHGYGGNWGGSGASYHHNLIAHHTSRTPRLGPRQSTQLDERMDMRNNVIYNWGGNGCYGGEGMNVNIVNNYYKLGPGTRQRSSTIQRRIAAPGIRTTEYCKITQWNEDGTPANGNGWTPMWHVWGKYFVEGNVNSAHSDVNNDNWTYGIYNQIDGSANDNTYTSRTKDTIRIDTPIPYGHITTHTAVNAYSKVVAYAGASFSRDSHDLYIVNDVETGTASHCAPGTTTGFVDSQNQAGGWPVLNSTAAPQDTDQDGMPDSWETAHGLNPNDASDRNNYNLDSRSYYTNLEVYCNELVEAITKQQNADADPSVEGSFEEWYPDYQNGETPEQASTVIYSHPGDKGNKITFDDGATLQTTGKLEKTIDPASNITVGESTYKSMKLSNGAQQTFTCPSTKKASSVTIYSYINADNDGTRCFWREVAGIEHTADEGVMQSWRDGEHPDSFTYPLDKVSSFTFTNSGRQVAIVMEVAYASESGIETVGVPGTAHQHEFYTLDGRRVLQQSPASPRGLRQGFYIHEGRKIIVY